MGFLGVYVATFGVWSFTYFRLHGLWLYPVRAATSLKPKRVNNMCFRWTFFRILLSQALQDSLPHVSAALRGW